MAGNIADYAENKILDHILGETAFTKPTVYLALYTTATNDSGAGTEVSTAGGTLYARLPLAGKLAAAAGGTKHNSEDLVFAVAGADWGTVTHAAIVDSASGAANMIWQGQLEASKHIETGDQYVIPASSLVCTLD